VLSRDYYLKVRTTTTGTNNNNINNKNSSSNINNNNNEKVNNNHTSRTTNNVQRKVGFPVVISRGKRKARTTKPGYYDTD